MITGTLPFTSKNGNEILHAHLARKPVPVHIIRKELPISISLVISKLLKKDPDKRYASIDGLIYDLKLCLQDFEKENRSDIHSRLQRYPGTNIRFFRSLWKR